MESRRQGAAEPRGSERQKLRSRDREPEGKERESGKECRETGAEVSDRWDHFDQDCLVMYTPYFLFKLKPHVKATKVDLESCH